MTEEIDLLPFYDEIYQRHKSLVALGIENLKIWELNDYHFSVRWLAEYYKQLSKATKSMEKKCK